MTIHRTRDDAPPDGAPEPGRQLTQIGNVFIEWSGPTPPDQAELDAHRHPPRVIPPRLIDIPASVNSVPALRDAVNQALAHLRGD